MPDMQEFVGEVLDSKYRLDETLGQGGMGAVFRATHLGTDRAVALKIIAPGLMDQQEFVARFQREARTTGRLRHPNIVDLTDFGFAVVRGRKLAYLVMELLEGESLADLLKRNPTPPLPFVVEVVQQVCSALQEAHDNGIIHRDLKPENLWLEPNRRGGHTVKILDFGLAKIYDPKARADGQPGLPVGEEETLALGSARTIPGVAPVGGEGTQLGTVLGTPAYMSPEQCRGIALDHRSDLYSLGVIVYQMLSGRPPFAGGSLDLINKHIQSDVPGLREARRDLPPGLAELVMEALSKDPARRPASAEIFGNALEAYATDMSAMVRNGLALYVDIFATQWVRCLKPFLGPLLVAILFLTLSVGMERHAFSPGGASEEQMALLWLDGLTYLSPLVWLWLGWLVYASMAMNGTITPVVLRKLLRPLSPVNVESFDQDRRVFEAYRRFNLLSAFPMALIVALDSALLGALLRYAITHGPASRSTVRIAAAAVVVIIVLSALVIVYLGRRLSGGSTAGMAGILFLEGKTLAEGRARLKQLRDLARTHIPARPFLSLKPNDPREELDTGPIPMLYVAIGSATATFVFGGIAIRDRLLLPAAPHPFHSSLGWLIIWITLLQALIAPLGAVVSALTYLRLRKLARESMREAYEGFEKRLSAAAPGLIGQ